MLKYVEISALKTPWPGGAAPGIGQKKTTFGMGFHEVLLWARRLREKAGGTGPGTGDGDSGEECRISTYWENALYDVTWGRLSNASSHDAGGSEAFFLQNLHEMFVVSLMTSCLRALCEVCLIQ